MILSSPAKETKADPRVNARSKKRVAAVALAGALLIPAVLTFPYWHIVADKITVECKQTPAFSYSANAEISNWQNCTRSQLRRLLQLAARPAPQAKIVGDEKVEQMMFDSTRLKLRRLKVELPSRSGKAIVGYLLLPATGSAKPLPCVVCVPGHGQGLDHAVGIDSDGLLFKMWDGTPRDYALFFAKRGYAVFCYEQYGIGYRSETGNNAKLERIECLLSDAKARYAGASTLAYRVDDALRVVDYVSGLPQVDASRVAMMGLSAGGTTTLFTAALDERIKCAVVASAFCTYADSTFRQAECICNYVPGLPGAVSSGDVAALIAPRALIIESGTVDDRFPARSAIVEFEKTKKTFSALGVPDKAVLDVENHGHRCFYGFQTDVFLKKYL